MVDEGHQSESNVREEAWHYDCEGGIRKDAECKDNEPCEEQEHRDEKNGG